MNSTLKCKFCGQPRIEISQGIGRVIFFKCHCGAVVGFYSGTDKPYNLTQAVELYKNGVDENNG